MKKEVTPCALCQRDVPPRFLEKHHLVPRSLGGEETIDVCNACGDQVHRLFSNQELAETYHTVAALKSDPRMQKWLRWVSRQRSFTFSMKLKRGR